MLRRRSYQLHRSCLVEQISESWEWYCTECLGERASHFIVESFYSNLLPGEVTVSVERRPVVDTMQGHVTAER